MIARSFALAASTIFLSLPILNSCGPSIQPTKEIVSETADIKDGTWKAYEFSALKSLRLSVSAKVTVGPAVDVITMTHEGYLAWHSAQTKLLAGGQYSYYPALSAQSVRAVSKTGALEQGKYVVVVYNPEAKLFSESVATVDVKVTAQSAD